jgi:hypothetical protein
MEDKETWRHGDMLDMETCRKELGAGTSVSVAKTSKGQTDGLICLNPFPDWLRAHGVGLQDFEERGAQHLLFHNSR